jgi:hypothetical protein
VFHSPAGTSYFCSIVRPFQALSSSKQMYLKERVPSLDRAFNLLDPRGELIIGNLISIR